VIRRLEAAAVVECSGEMVSLTVGWLEALNQDRERAEEIDAYRRDMADYNREREGYRNRYRHKPDRSPSTTEMAAARRERGALTEEEEKDAEAIVAYEERHGGGTFRWDYASCKRLFYKTGRWPDAELLTRIKAYLGVAREAV
jgi:hypothetical protein